MRPIHFQERLAPWLEQFKWEFFEGTERVIKVKKKDPTRRVGGPKGFVVELDSGDVFDIAITMREKGAK